MRRRLATSHDVVVFGHAAPVLERIGAGDRPDILLLDWMMPEISGLDAFRFVRETTDEASLPIVTLTANDTPDALAPGLAAGANDFLRKPFDQTELLARVGALLRMKRLHDRLTVASRPPARSDLP